MSELPSKNNARAMPAPLRLLISLGFIAPLFVFGSFDGIRVLDILSSGPRWWAYGGMGVLLIGAVAMFAAAYGMSRRSKWGVPIYVTGSVSFSFAGLIVMHVAKISVEQNWFVIAGQLAFSGIIATYLYANKKVKKYFCGAHSQKNT